MVGDRISARGESGDKKVIIAGDVSATNVLLGVYKTSPASGIVTLSEHVYNGQEISNFTEVIDDIIKKAKINKVDISSMVLSPAGPISADRQKCKMTNAPFSIDLSGIGIESYLINDFEAIAFAVATGGIAKKLACLQLNHTGVDQVRDRPESYQNIGIIGAGTGLGEARLYYDREKKLYFPLASEGGHKFLSIDASNEVEVGLSRYISKNVLDGRVPHQEEVLSGRGIKHIFDYLFETLKPADESKCKHDESDGLNQASDKAEYIATTAKENPNSLSARAMELFWTFYGRAARDVAVHETATGGVWVAGGIMRKNIEVKPGSNKIDEKVARAFMKAFDSGPTHRDWVNKIPVHVIMDARVGLTGSIASASNTHYTKYLKSN